jgi:predicted PurR-regulated permease PerM
MYDNVLSVLHNRWIQSLGLLLALVLAGLLFYFISPLLIPVFLAMLVAYLLNPVVRFLEKKGVRRSITATSLALLSLLVFVSIPVIVVPQLIHEADRLVKSARQTVARELKQSPNAVHDTWLDRTLELLPLQEFVLAMGWWPPEVAAQAEQAPAVDVTVAPQAEGEPAAPSEVTVTAPVEITPTSPATDAELSLSEQVKAAGIESPVLTDELARAIVADHIYTGVRENIQSIARRYAGQFTGAIKSGSTTVGDLFRFVYSILVKVLALLVNFSVFAFATGYLMVSFDRLEEHTRGIIPLQYKDRTLSILGKVDFQMRSFVRGQVLVATINAVIYSIGLTISGVPFGALIGLLTGFLTFIPYVGVSLGLITSVLLVLVQYGFDWHLVGVLVTFMAVQSMEEVVSRPLILGDKIGLHPVWVMAAFLVFGHAFGFVGVLVAVPLAAILKVFVLEFYEYYRHTKLYDLGQKGPE